jgi:hypothetical protein
VRSQKSSVKMPAVSIERLMPENKSEILATRYAVGQSRADLTTFFGPI